MTHSLRTGWAPAPGRQRNVLGWLANLSVFTVGLMLAGLAVGTAPKPLAVAVAVVLVVMGVWFVKPLAALHATVFLTLVGDITSVTWWPFTKNMSSHESIMFVADSVSVSPLEVMLLVATVAMLVRYLATGVWPFVRGRNLLPVAVLTAFIIIGLMYGMATGGDFRAATLEVRPFLVLPVVYVLVTSLCRTTSHYRHLLWTVFGAILLHAVLTLQYVQGLTKDQRAASESLIEHSSALRMNVLIIALIGALLVRGVTKRMKITLGVAAVPVLWAYFLAERRAAFVSLGVATILLFMVLFWRQRDTFKKVFPIVAVVLVGYLGVFWNTTSSVGFPAQAVKSVIAPESLSDRDESSDLYRVIENFDLNYTIRSARITGLGFGHTFYRPIPLADISTFEFYLFIPHNSVLNVWVKAGFGGFAALFFLFGSTMVKGGQRVRRVREGRDLVVLFCGLAYVAMLLVFAYVDIAWDARVLMLFGLAVAMCCDMPVPEVEADEPLPEEAETSALALIRS